MPFDRQRARGSLQEAGDEVQRGKRGRHQHRAPPREPDTIEKPWIGGTTGRRPVPLDVGFRGSVGLGVGLGLDDGRWGGVEDGELDPPLAFPADAAVMTAGGDGGARGAGEEAAAIDAPLNERETDGRRPCEREAHRARLVASGVPFERELWEPLGLPAEERRDRVDDGIGRGRDLRARVFEVDSSRRWRHRRQGRAGRQRREERRQDRPPTGRRRPWAGQRAAT